MMSGIMFQILIWKGSNTVCISVRFVCIQLKNRAFFVCGICTHSGLQCVTVNSNVSVLSRMDCRKSIVDCGLFL